MASDVSPVRLDAYSCSVNAFRQLTSRMAPLALVLALASPAVASAKTKTIAPPGNSGIGQYVESVPTASGGRPTGTVHRGGGSQGSGGGIPGGGSGGSGPGSGSAVSASTTRALGAQGADGAAAASLARATAPSSRSHGTGSSKTTGSRPNSTAANAPQTGSPTSSVFKALTGSSTGGGLGPVLPVVLIVSLLGGAVLALRRRRTT